MPEPIYYRRKLPHIHPQNSPLFITFSLVDSLPAAVVDELKAQREQELRAAKTAADRYNIQKNISDISTNGSTVVNSGMIGSGRKTSRRLWRMKSTRKPTSITNSTPIASCPITFTFSSARSSKNFRHPE